MAAYQKHIGSFFVGLYVWILTISFGMVLLDTIYSHLVPEATAAFSAVSDFLLLVSFATLLSAVVAIAFSWRSTTVRNLLIASLLVILFELFIPSFLSPFVQDSQELAICPWLRIIPGGVASILAFISMNNY